jgi:hypothetical protein
MLFEHRNGSDGVGETIAHYGRAAATSHDGQTDYSGVIRMADRRARKSHYPRQAISTSFSSVPSGETTAILP